MDIKTIIACMLLLMILFVCIFLVVKFFGMNNVRKKTYQLFVFAENEILGSKKGQEKLDFVVDKAYFLLPKAIQLFFPKSVLRWLINKWFQEAKDLLDDGRFNLSQGDLL